MGFFSVFSAAARKKRQAAISVGLHSGLFQECPVCRDITEGQASTALLRQTEELAERWVAEGDARVAAFEGDAQALRQQIRETLRKAPVSCTCENI